MKSTIKKLLRGVQTYRKKYLRLKFISWKNLIESMRNMDAQNIVKESNLDQNYSFDDMMDSDQNQTKLSKESTGL